MGYKKVPFGSLKIYHEDTYFSIPIPKNPTCSGDIPTYVQGDRIAFGQANSNRDLIYWIKPDHLPIFVADRVLLKAISYSDEVWHWSTAFTICSDFLNDGHRVVRGCISANGYNHCSPSTRDSEKGFRPVLIPLDSTQKEKGKKCILDSHAFFVRGVKKAAANEIFLPVLEPADPTLYDGLVMNELYAYTLLMNGVPVRQDRAAPETYIDGATLELTDIFYGKEYLISWNILNGTAVANKGILRKVGVESLTTLGLLLNKKG